MHILDIDIDDSNLNPRAFKVLDNSVYDSTLAVKNCLLEIIPPGFSYPMVFRVKKNFSEIFNANLLHLNTSDCKEVPSIPDGAYRIKYSVDPNTQTVQEYYYFRNTKQQNSYYDILTKFIDSRPKFSNKEFEKRKLELVWLGLTMKAAKIMAEDGLNISKANSMYKQVESELKDFKSC